MLTRTLRGKDTHLVLVSGAASGPPGRPARRRQGEAEYRSDRKEVRRWGGEVFLGRWDGEQVDGEEGRDAGKRGMAEGK